MKMINEYLFINDENKVKIKEITQKGIFNDSIEIKDKKLWIARYYSNDYTKESAKKLSIIHEKIVKYSPNVLSCGSSEYYNKNLFPLINELERKLRKLLYLATSISDTDAAKNEITKLEEKDFGQIFDLIFIDNKFLQEVRNGIDGKSSIENKIYKRYSKEEMKKYIDSIEEDTLWNKILGESHVKSLKCGFRDVQKYRNSVMHAHNINYEIFKEAKNLFSIINKELDSAIKSLIDSGKDSLTNSEISEAISLKLEYMEESEEAERYENYIKKYITIKNSIDSIDNELLLNKLNKIKASSTNEMVDLISIIKLLNK